MQKTLFPSGRDPFENRHEKFSRNDLNEAQLEAATAMGSPILVIAGAGTGKTRTLVYRMAYLIEQGVPADNILLLTFTRKASQEMTERAGRLIDDQGQRVTGGTFHSVANVLLRRYAHHLGYPANFTILDRSDSEGIINLLKSSMDLGGAGKRFPTRRMICNLFSRSVNKCQDLVQTVDEQYSHLHENLPELEKIRDNYRKFKLEHGLMDYDDLLVNLRKVLAEHDAVRREVADRFHHILVDEYQDTNPIQAEIVKLIAAGRNNVMVVGDDSQSIYSFRGADFRNIMDFPKIFSGTRIVRLEENYRSTQPILAMTNAIIEKAEEKYTKKLFSSIEGKERPVLQGLWDENAQARWVVDRIDELGEKGVPLREIAVLFRSGFHSYKLELELTNRQYVFEKRGGMRLTESAHIKDVLSYLRVVNNPQDNLSWNRILLLLDKVGPQTARKILEEVRNGEDALAAIRDYPGKGSWRPGLLKMVEMLELIGGHGMTPVKMFDTVMEYYQEIFERVYHDDYPTRTRDLEQMRQLVSGYGDLQTLMDDTTLDPPEAAADSGGATDGECLILSTIHSAKGLEWDNVFVINMAAGRFPSCQPFMRDEWEEERRMFYVAATRARKKLFLSYPREVMTFDRQAAAGGISPFLAEIPSSLFDSGTGGGESRGFAAGPAPGNKFRQTAKKKTPDLANLKEGTQVNHSFFGRGTVEKMAGSRSVEVFFPRHGRKTLHLDYARLEVIE
ncbi:MAG: ATP-dependent helicase [Proteobacteria bacterium]|nr:ATP-dependent helicase [Pseudomonadota bacterium]MBU1736727.1 ATP-dependent helicase [Pseudomonadota bacterium]